MKNFLFTIKRFFLRVWWNAWLALSQPFRNRLLYKLINGKRVLIIGSGQSVQDLDTIPDGILVFACNTSPEILRRKKLRKSVDLYIVSKPSFVVYRGIIEPILQDISITVCATKHPWYIRKRKWRGDVSYRYLIRDRAAGSKSNYYLKQLIAPIPVADIVGSSAKQSTSSGLGLLQYALYYGAREIYLIGIDLDMRGIALTERTNEIYEKAHKDIEHNFMRIAAEKYPFIYSASQNSPITSFVPYKPLK